MSVSSCGAKQALIKKCASGCSRRAVAIANATSRSGGAVGGQAIVPRLVRRFAQKGQKILDFGAGKQAAHAQAMRQAGYNVTAHDFGDNVVPGVHAPDALRHRYDMVYASNVLNVQSSPAMLNATLGQIAAATKPGGMAIANFPDSPRKLSLTADRLKAMAQRKFRRVEQMGGSDSAPVLKLSK